MSNFGGGTPYRTETNEIRRPMAGYGGFRGSSHNSRSRQFGNFGRFSMESRDDGFSSQSNFPPIPMNNLRIHDEHVPICEDYSKEAKLNYSSWNSVTGRCIQNSVKTGFALIELEAPGSFTSLTNYTQNLRVAALDKNTLVLTQNGKKRMQPRQLPIGARVRIHELEKTDQDSSEDSELYFSELCQDPVFRISLFSPVELPNLQEEICLSSSANVYGSRIVGPSFDGSIVFLPEHHQDENEYRSLLNSLDEQPYLINELKHRFLFVRFYKIPTGFYESPVSKQDRNGIRIWRRSSRPSWKKSLQIVDVRFLTDQEVEYIRQISTIPADDERMINLYIRDARIALGKLQHHIQSKEIKDKTIETQFKGQINSSNPVQRYGLVYFKISDHQKQDLFDSNTFVRWGERTDMLIKSPLFRDYKILAVLDSCKDLDRKTTIDEHGEEKIHVESYEVTLRIGMKCVDIWENILQRGSYQRITVGPMDEARDPHSVYLQENFERIRNEPIFISWMQCRSWEVEHQTDKTDSIEPLGEIRLDASQLIALKKSHNQEGMIGISAAAGTGKSTLQLFIEKMHHVRNKLERKNRCMVVCAQTNAAVDNHECAISQYLTGVRYLRLTSHTLDNKHLNKNSLRQMVRNAGEHVNLAEYPAVLQLLDQVDNLDRQLKTASSMDSHHCAELLKMRDQKLELLEHEFLGAYKPEIILSTLDKLNTQRIKAECVVLDEAGLCTSISVLCLLGSVSGIRKITMIGDHRMLTPHTRFISDSEANGIYDHSELARMGKETTAAFCNLINSYRGHPAIVLYVHTTIYPELIPVRENKSCLDHLDIPRSAMKDPFGFITVPDNEDRKKEEVADHPIEREIAIRLIRRLRQGGVESSNIVVLCHHKNQKNKLITDLSERKLKIDVNTVDSYQGKEHLVFIILTTKTDRIRFVAQPQRATVCMSRAKEAFYFLAAKSVYTKFAFNSVWPICAEKARERGAFLDSHTFLPIVETERRSEAEHNGNDPQDHI